MVSPFGPLRGPAGFASRAGPGRQPTAVSSAYVKLSLESRLGEEFVDLLNQSFGSFAVNIVRLQNPVYTASHHAPNIDQRKLGKGVVSSASRYPPLAPMR